ncbi:hypothetical protein A9P82_08320 [Arachidicoccus ginsenosidimutans]|uniref:hypothetical protein n=1 Tax=Arachidicoccus sp. BS20 TaxID=1850526 RepID=UPI0007F13772|nr:hypothetical protein [Arachidicoccus sp. BS20]ANI89294.1 hypothetical protein A9P82_08320 [Arachidicoccus sp. BS20]
MRVEKIEDKSFGLYREINETKQIAIQYKGGHFLFREFLKFVVMEAVKKHTVSKNPTKAEAKKTTRSQERGVVMITKQRISAKESLFPEKLKKANELLKNAVLMKH